MQYWLFKIAQLVSFIKNNPSIVEINSAFNRNEDYVKFLGEKNKTNINIKQAYVTNK